MVFPAPRSRGGITRVLPDAAAPLAGDEPVRACGAPVCVWGGERRDGCRDERARRRNRGAARPSSDVPLHGGWSVGGFTAAGFVALAATAGLDPRVESLIVCVCLFLMSLWITRRLGASSSHSSEGHGLALPTRPVILIGGLCFLVMLAEGAIGDWSGIYLRHNTGASPATAALAFTAFLGWPSRDLAVICKRADWRQHLLRVGTAMVAIALGGVLVIDHTIPPSSALYCAASGSRSGTAALERRRTNNSARASLAAAFTLGYTGFIVGRRLSVFSTTPDFRKRLRYSCRASHRDGAWRQGAGRRQPACGGQVGAG